MWLLDAEELAGCSVIPICMGTVRAWPKAVIEHLVKWCSRPWEHRWK